MSYQHSKTAISSLMSLQCSNPLLDDRFSADAEPPNGKQQNLRRHEWPSQQPRRECSDFRRIPMKSGPFVPDNFFQVEAHKLPPLSRHKTQTSLPKFHSFPCTGQLPTLAFRYLREIAAKSNFLPVRSQITVIRDAREAYENEQVTKQSYPTFYPSVRIYDIGAYLTR